MLKESSNIDNGKEALGDLFKRNLSETYRDISEIIRAKIELAKLDVFEVFAEFSSFFIAGLIGFGGFLLLLLSLAFYLGEIFGKTSLGFLTVGCALLVISFLLYKVMHEEFKAFILHRLFKSEGEASLGKNEKSVKKKSELIEEERG
ncbi:MAG: hypothetical protein SFU91_10180 [Chloroherpetonaceae bacterium]|nr:hypothetical protein [Chloroherpetonaceae bacterium]